MDISAGGYSLNGLSKVNVILGKNGCGKSTLLKELDTQLQVGDMGRKKYVTPERGGVLSFEANVEQNLASPDWMPNSRRVNQFERFRQQRFSQFRRLEYAVYRESEERGAVAQFGPYIDQLNSLLDNVELRRDDTAFQIFSKSTGQTLGPNIISSGEAELISLGIEALMFAKEIDPTKSNYLLLDEPDVHLHPDLQARLINFLTALVDEYQFTVITATHSTAVLGGLARYAGAAVAFMKAGDLTLNFEPIGDIHRRILPVFGAHPLSNIFNEAPVLLVEGDDDERLWQQAVRSSHGVLNVYPVACEGVTEINNYESEVRRIIAAVYEQPQAFSLRDRDGLEGELEDQPPIIRMRLACRAAENLLLADEVLTACDLDWPEAERRIDSWLSANGVHQRHPQVQAFKDSGYDRRDQDLKEIRTILAGMVLNSTKSWEVLVGRAIAQLRQPERDAIVPDDSLLAYLGAKMVANVIPPGRPA
jgi:energy-coupling factor transporter ATP-binding protein EcfA2